jgi:hypothetical protein
MGIISINKIKTIIATMCLMGNGIANADIIEANLEDVTNGGGFFATVTFLDVCDSAMPVPNCHVLVTADIADPINAGLTQGDILGLGMNVTDESLLGDLLFGTIVSDPAGIVTGSCQTADSCDLFMGGSGSPGEGYDITVDLGVQGSDAGFIETLSFSITGITAGEFADQLIGMRVQSIEGVSTFAEGSSKLIGSGGGTTPVPEPGTLALFGIGLLSIGFSRRRSRKK